MILGAGSLAGRIPAAIADAVLVVFSANEVRDCQSVIGRVGGHAIAADTGVGERSRITSVAFGVTICPRKLQTNQGA